MGRPNGYSPEIAEEICERLAAGESLRKICRDDHLPPESTVRQWALDDRQGFAAQYTRARDIGIDCMADEILDIAHDGSNDWIKTEKGTMADFDHINRSRLRVDSLKWYLSKLAPKRYGDSMKLTGNGPNESVELNIRSATDEP